MKTFNFSLYDKKHLARMMAKPQYIQSLFELVIKEAVRLGMSVNPDDPDIIFKLSDYPVLERKIEEDLQQLHDDLTLFIEDGDREEWTYSNEKNDALIDYLSRHIKVPKEQIKTWKNPHTNALVQFLKRKIGGMNLSEKVWNITNQFKNELELALDVGLGEGKSAATMTKEVKQYLVYPDKLFRRVRDKRGALHLSKAAKAFHPGQGVYRSSYKNALRLTGTENNIAYRMADYERWQKLDFVIGIKVMLSNNHPVYDICDELKGNYPKTFMFLGWHPQCRCFAVPILASDDEIDEKLNKKIAGEDVSNFKFKGEIKKMPEVFTKWYANNKDRIARAKNMPYFLSYNDKLIKATSGNNAVEIAKKRHEERTPEQIKDIKQKWNERVEKAEIAGMVKLMPDNLTETEKIAIAKNNIEIEKALKIKIGEPMSVEDADKQNANPNYTPKFIPDPNGLYRDEDGRRYSLNKDYNEKKDKPYSINCQTCAPAYALRLRGFDIKAKGKIKGSLQDYLSRQHSFDAWFNADGTIPNPIFTIDWMSTKGYKRMNAKRYKEYFEDVCKEEGVYLLTIGWKKGGGHATILQKFANGELKYIEPQRYVQSKGIKRLIDELSEKGATVPIHTRGVLRIDNKIFNTKFLSIFSK